jgi:predicted TIM-barrel fold metal-dependent hydrolase
MSDIDALPLSRPKKPLPPDACDCHAHVFGPFDRFPLAQERTYTPPLAPAEAYWTMLRKMGFSRAVVVQPSAYGVDNTCTLAAIESAAGRMRGIGVVDPSITDAQLAQLGEQGIRGMRFTEIVTREGGKMRGAAGFDALRALGPRLREHDMHAQIFAALDDFMAAAPELLQLGIPLVLDHMGRVGPGSRAPSDPTFRNLLALLAEGRVWIKLTAFRNSTRFPDYEDVRPFHDALLMTNPDRLVWGSDWPLLNTAGRTPDIGRLLDTLDAWIDDDALRERILVANPARLYGFEQRSAAARQSQP